MRHCSGSAVAKLLPAALCSLQKANDFVSFSVLNFSKNIIFQIADRRSERPVNCLTKLMVKSWRNGYVFVRFDGFLGNICFTLFA